MDNIRYKKALLFICCISSLVAYDRASSYPYLSGDTWRFFADFRLSGKTSFNEEKETFNPRKVQPGDTIFVEYDSLKRFAKYLPKIRNRFILITPNCESGTDNPQPGQFAALLDSPKIAAWFVQNIDRPPTSRVIPIPIGLANQVWPHGQISILDPIASSAPPFGSEKRDLFIFINFSINTNSHAREPCFKHFQSLPSTTFKQSQSFEEYLRDLSRSVFVVSPPGNGQDCHRTWEALLMGCYPIVLSSTLNPLYEGLPIVVVSNWEEVTEEFLRQKQKEFKSKSWELEKLYAPYWYQKVFAIQKKLRKNATLIEKVISCMF